MITYQKDIRKYKKKPQDAGRLKKHLGMLSASKSADVKEFALDCLKYSVAPITISSDAANGLEDNQWVAQQAFLFDIDNSAIVLWGDGRKETIKRLPTEYVDLKEILSICQGQGILPAFIYTTLSHTGDWNRYRVGFVADNKIADKKERDQFVKSMARLLSKNEYSIIDTACLDLGRIFYPGLEMVYEDYSAVVSVTDVIDKGKKAISYILEYTCDSNDSYSPNSKLEIGSLTATSANHVVSMIKNYDIEGLQLRLIEIGLLPLLSEGGSEQEGRLNPCKIRDCWFPVNLFTLNQGVIYNSSISSLYSTSYNVGKFTEHGTTLVITRGFKDIIHITSAIPLTDFFDMGSSTNCICHEDTKPSATVRSYIDEDDGSTQYRYFCHSNSCSLNHTTDNDVYSANIIDLIASIQGTSIGKAINFLARVLNVKFISISQIEAYSNLDAYLEYLSDENTFSQEYPKLYRYIKPHIGKLKEFLKVSRKYIAYLADINTNEEGLIISVSLRKLQEEFQAVGLKGVYDLKRLNERLTLFSLLGLIEKVEESKIMDKQLTEARRASVYTNVNGYEVQCRYHTAFYKIPVFNKELLNYAEQQVQGLIEQKYSRSHLSFETIRRAKGEQITKKVFPQSEGRELNTYYDKLQNTIEDAILAAIDTKGYAHKLQILSKIRGYSAKDKESAYMKLLPAIMEKNNICWLRVNNETRAKYKVDSSILSNSHIIVKKENK